jgi:hypothetical protein
MEERSHEIVDISEERDTDMRIEWIGALAKDARASARRITCRTSPLQHARMASKSGKPHPRPICPLYRPHSRNQSATWADTDGWILLVAGVKDR